MSTLKVFGEFERRPSLLKEFDAVAACYSASRVCGLLRAGVAIDVAFGRLDRPMPGEKLNVPQTSPGLVDVPRGDGDEAPPTRMRRAGFKAERLVKRREPIHDAVGLQMRAPIGADHPTYRRAARARQTLKRAPQIGMHGNAPAAALFRNGVADMDRAAHTTLRVENHRPIEAGDFARPQAGFDREQDHGAVAGGITGREGDIFRACVAWSVVLMLVLCLLVCLQSTSALSWMLP